GATKVATWNDGTPLMAYKGRAVGLSAYVGDVQAPFSGDYARVIANAGRFLSPPSCPPPTIACPANIQTFTDSGKSTATVNPGTPATSGGTGTVTVTGVRSDGKPLTDPYPLGVTSISWTAKDSANKTASCGQTITVLTPSGGGYRPGLVGPRRLP